MNKYYYTLNGSVKNMVSKLLLTDFGGDGFMVKHKGRSLVIKSQQCNAIILVMNNGKESHLVVNYTRPMLTSLNKYKIGLKDLESQLIKAGVEYIPDNVYA